MIQTEATFVSYFKSRFLNLLYATETLWLIKACTNCHLKQIQLVTAKYVIINRALHYETKNWTFCLILINVN